jgi:SAM-dependent methyltransferase
VAATLSAPVFYGAFMSANWTSGYVGDVSYTLGFYRELAPTFLHFCAVVNGVEGPALNRPLRYCELGCGRGYGTSLLAAANPNFEFVGIDFNPSHVAEARSLAARANIPNVTFFETSFADAARSSDRKLAEFDIIVLHGVYTWVERNIRNDICAFIREKLLAGGLLYNSYNVLPGWATAMPIQHLLMEVARRSSRDSLTTLKEGYEILRTLVEKSSGFVTQNPGVKARIENMGKQDQAYLVHEFLNAGWEPLYITDVMANFAEAKLTFIGSTTLVENRIELCVPKDLQPLLRATPDLAMRELLKDYAINKQFRRDIYMKGPQILPQQEQRQRFREIVFSLATMTQELPEKFTFPVGELTPKREALAALIEALRDKPASGADLIAAGEKVGLREADTNLLLMLLVQGSVVAPTRPDHASMDRSASDRLNEAIMTLSVAGDTHRYMCAPVQGSAFGASFVDRLVAPLIAKSPKDGDVAIARKAFEKLERAGRGFYRDGRTLEKSDENIQEIGRAVTEFRQQRLARWRALGAIA